MPIKLSTIKHKQSTDDLVPVMLERITNQFGELSNRFLIHVNDDVFGVFSENYTYISSKELVRIIEQHTSLRMSHKRYNKGILTVYLEDPADDAQLLEQLELIKLAKLLMDYDDDDLMDIVSRSGIFFVNSYNGASKLVIGLHISVRSAETVLFDVPVMRIFKDAQAHLPQATNFIKSLDISRPNILKSLEQLKSINTAKFVRTLQYYFPKKKLQMILESLSSFKPQYSVIDLLACLGYMFPYDTSLCVNIVSQFLNESAENQHEF